MVNLLVECTFTIYGGRKRDLADDDGRKRNKFKCFDLGA